MAAVFYFPPCLRRVDLTVENEILKVKLNVMFPQTLSKKVEQVKRTVEKLFKDPVDIDWNDFAIVCVARGFLKREGEFHYPDYTDGGYYHIGNSFMQLWATIKWYETPRDTKPGSFDAFIKKILGVPTMLRFYKMLFQDNDVIVSWENFCTPTCQIPGESSYNDKTQFIKSIVGYFAAVGEIERACDVCDSIMLAMTTAPLNE